MVPIGSARLFALAARQECSSPHQLLVFAEGRVGHFVSVVRLIRSIEPFESVATHVQYAIGAQVAGSLAHRYGLSAPDICSICSELVSPGILALSARHGVPR